MGYRNDQEALEAEAEELRARLAAARSEVARLRRDRGGPEGARLSPWVTAAVALLAVALCCVYVFLDVLSTLTPG